MNAFGITRKYGDVSSDLSIQFKVEHNLNNVQTPITDVFMTGSNKHSFKVVDGGSPVQSYGEINVKVGAVNNAPSYGKYRVALYMQSQDQFY